MLVPELGGLDHRALSKKGARSSGCSRPTLVSYIVKLHVICDFSVVQRWVGVVLVSNEVVTRYPYIQANLPKEALHVVFLLDTGLLF